MPTSIDPLPADNEVECANCGAFVYIELTRCPNCGVNLYEPEDTQAERASFRVKGKLALKVESVMRKLRGEAHPAEELFSGALKEAALFDDLLKKVGGDRAVVERLIAYEGQQKPNATRLVCLQNSIRHWERGNT